MRKLTLWMALLLGGLFFLFSCEKDEANPLEGTVRDPAGREYLWRRMNDGQNWLTANLNYAVSGLSHRWYDDNPANGVLYGRLYEWGAAKAACEALGDGWRLPDDADWTNLATAYGGLFDWETVSETGDPAKAYTELIAGGDSRFGALLGGYEGMGFNKLGRFGMYWSATERAVGAETLVGSYQFDSESGKLYRLLAVKTYKYSCRCVQGGLD